MHSIRSSSQRILLTWGPVFAIACADSTSPSQGSLIEQPKDAATNQIAYQNLGTIVLIKSDGSAGIGLASPGWAPSWSPDGKRLVFSNTQCDTDWTTYIVCERGGLVILDVESGQVSTPAAGFVGQEPSWSPNGDRIAFTRRDTGQLYVMQLDGSAAQDLHIEASGSNNPSWSPDGRRIVFQCQSASICTVNADGTGFTMIGNSENGDARLSPSWSPDGTQLLFTSYRGGFGKIAITAADGTGQILLADGLGPAWSTDGMQIAFSRNNDGLYTMNRDGSNVKRIVAGMTSRPAWRPAR